MVYPSGVNRPGNSAGGVDFGSFLSGGLFFGSGGSKNGTVLTAFGLTYIMLELRKRQKLFEGLVGTTEATKAKFVAALQFIYCAATVMRELGNSLAQERS